MFEIFQYDFLARGFVAAVAVAVLAPTIGMFLVVRRQAFLADTLAHVSLAGVAAGLLFAFNPAVGAVGASVLVALLLERLRSRRGFLGESALSLILSASLALAVILIGLSKGLNAGLFSYLFGSITTVSSADLQVLVALGTVAVAIVVLNVRHFFLVALDEELALASGVPARAFSVALTVLSGLTVALSLRIVGALLVGALMVIPVLAASRFNFGFRKTHLLAVLLSLFAVAIGFFLSYGLDLPAGGTIVGVAVLIFLAAFLFGRK